MDINAELGTIHSILVGEAVLEHIRRLVKGNKCRVINSRRIGMWDGSVSEEVLKRARHYATVVISDGEYDDGEDVLRRIKEGMPECDVDRITEKVIGISTARRGSRNG